MDASTQEQETQTFYGNWFDKYADDIERGYQSSDND